MTRTAMTALGLLLVLCGCNCAKHSLHTKIYVDMTPAPGQPPQPAVIQIHLAPHCGASVELTSQF